VVNDVNQQYGPHRRPVGGARTTVSSETPGGRAWPAVARYASGAERCLLGFAHRRSLARSAASLSFLPNLSSPIPAVAAVRVAHSTAAETGGRLTRSRKAGPERILHRCHLQFGEKRGSAVGPTRRGKGSKIIAISDGHGLPLAVHVASASPHETKLVEPTLQRRFLAETPERLIGDRAYDSDPWMRRFANASVCSWLLRATPRAAGKPRKMVACCTATVAAGKSSACSLGFTIFVGWSSAGNITQRISSGWCSLLAPSSS
jgi:transposase